MWKKLFIILGCFLAIEFTLLFFIKVYKESGHTSKNVSSMTAKNEANPAPVKPSSVSAFGNLNKPTRVAPTEAVTAVAKSLLADKEVINILLIGIDRRSKDQSGFNTDSLILVSAKPKTNKVLLTSVPRDLWVNGNKINALYSIYGPDTLGNAFEKITGQKVDGYVLTDFADFKWIIDAFGGVPVNVERDFSDSEFPNNQDSAVMTVNFKEGLEKMSGERALIYARSRKGTNGEGSDLMRAKRQHIILKGLTEAIKQDGSQFWPMKMDYFYQTVTAVNKMKTTLSLLDAVYLWDFYKDKEKYSVESFVIGSDYLYHPGVYPASEYYAWVFIPLDATWAKLHKDISDKLDGVFVAPNTNSTP